MRIPSTGAPLYRLKVTLRGSRPPIWRRFVVPSDITLEQFHYALQAVMGWTNSHMHQFEAGGILYRPSSPKYDAEDESRTILARVLRRPKESMRYEYDFGDSWLHDIVLEAVLPGEPQGIYPRIEAGRRACPPEDVGGIYGYERFLEALRDPTHPEHEDVREWIGEEFDPEAFSVPGAKVDTHRGRVRMDPDE